jgi:hypothetical protein
MTADTEPKGLPPIDWSCLRCHGVLENLGVVDFRSGGHSGGANFFLGSWGELGESTIPFVVLRCPRCGHVDLHVPERFPAG